MHQQSVIIKEFQSEAYSTHLLLTWGSINLKCSFSRSEGLTTQNNLEGFQKQSFIPEVFIYCGYSLIDSGVN